MGKNGVKVIIRTRPTANFASHQIQIDHDENTVTIYANQNPTSSSSPTHDSSPTLKTVMGPSNRKDCWKFKYHQILHNTSQDKVYEAIARDIVHGAVVDGINGTILAYGQTGAGKSFTMIGDTKNYHHRGIAPRALAQVFEQVDNRIEVSYAIKVSYMEIYNDRIYDLLNGGSSSSYSSATTNNSSTSSGNNHSMSASNSSEGLLVNAGSSQAELVVVEDAKGVTVRGLTQVEIATEQDALDQLFNGELQRTVAEHQLNKRSNRSHCIFTVHISQKSRIGGNERVIHSKLHLVDLAGSERLKKTMMVHESGNDSLQNTTTKKESMYINQSLSFLEQCIVALGSKDQRHVPYRQTKLTNVLKDSLGGNSNTLMFACIWGESKHLEETISTLKLAQRMMRVQNEIATIVETDPAILLRKYEKQIKELKHELLMHDALAERTGIVYDEHTPEQKHLLMKMVREYVDADSQEKEDEVLKLNSVRDIRELFRQFKLLLKNAETAISNGEVSALALNNAALPIGSRSNVAAGARNESSHHSGDLANDNGRSGSGEPLVGDDEPAASGFALGRAPNGAKPTSMDTVPRITQTLKTGAMEFSTTAAGTATTTAPGSMTDSESKTALMPDDGKEPVVQDLLEGDPSAGIDGAAPVSAANQRFKNEAFKFYRNGPGRKTYKSLLEDKEQLNDAKSRVKEITVQLSGIKNQIDQTRRKIEEKKQSQLCSVTFTNCSRSTGATGSGSATKNQGLASFLNKTKKKKNPTNALGSPVKTAGLPELEDEQEEQIVDEEEFMLMKEERDAKREYRVVFESFKAARAEMEFIERSVELCRMQLVREFEEWMEEQNFSNDLESLLGSTGGASLSSGGVLPNATTTFQAMTLGSPMYKQEDKLDDGEKFDQMEIERVRSRDPDSLAFFQAQKKMRQTAGSNAVKTKQLRKVKRGV